MILAANEIYEEYFAGDILPARAVLMQWRVYQKMH